MIFCKEIILPGFFGATIYANDDTTEYGYSVFNGQSHTGEKPDEK